MSGSTDQNMSVIKADTGGIRFYSPDAPEFSLEGFVWRQRGMPFDRLAGYPDTREFSANILAWGTFSAGGVLRFCSDTDRIVIRAEFRRAHRIVRMALTGIMGFDLYVRGDNGRMNFHGVTAFDFDAMAYCVDLFRDEERKMREFLIHFPLYGDLQLLEIGVSELTHFAPPPLWPDPRPLVCYGTSILHGACANRPGMAYPAQLSRLLERPTRNFGFAGSARGEAYMARMLAEVPSPCGYLLDYDPNSGWDNTRATLPGFVAILREKHPTVPIVVLSNIPYPKDRSGFWAAGTEGAQERARLERELVETLPGGNLHFISGMDLLDDDFEEASADGVHLTDYGLAQLAKSLNIKLRGILCPLNEHPHPEAIPPK